MPSLSPFILSWWETKLDINKNGKGEKQNEKIEIDSQKRPNFDFFRLMRMRQKQKSCLVTSDWWQILPSIFKKDRF